MKLICSKCGTTFSSLIIDQELAYKEVFNKSVKHITTSHRAMFEEMQKSVAIGVGALTTFMHLSEFCLIPEDQIRLTAAMEQAQELILACVGYDPEEDDEEDELEDANETTDEPPATDPIEVEPQHTETALINP